MAIVQNGKGILSKVSIPWLGHTNITDRRETDRFVIANTLHNVVMFGKNQNKPISTFRVTRVLQKLDSTIGQQNTCDKMADIYHSSDIGLNNYRKNYGEKLKPDKSMSVSKTNEAAFQYSHPHNCATIWKWVPSLLVYCRHPFWRNCTSNARQLAVCRIMPITTWLDHTLK